MSITSNGQPERHVNRSGMVRLVCALAAAQLGLHTWFAVSAGDPRMWMPHAVAWLLDVFVLIVVAAVLGGSVGGCGAGGSPPGRGVTGATPSSC